MSSTAACRPAIIIARCAVVLPMLAMGCQSDPTSATQTGAAKRSRGSIVLGNLFGGDSKRQLQSGAGAEGDRAPAAAGTATARELTVQQLDVYLLTVPIGVVSRSDEFWKRVDEMNVEPATHDLLYKNGIRVGIGQSSEWAYFKGILDQHPARTKTSGVAGGAKGAVQLEVKPKVPFQNIFYFNDANVLYGRTYEQSENLLALSFQPAPRKTKTVRVSICPVVRALRKRFEVTIRGDEREIEYVAPESLYDLNLITDVPLDGFLVIAPSPVAKWPSSLGHNFLIGGDVAEQTEQVILLVPKLGRLQPVAPVRG